MRANIDGDESPKLYSTTDVSNQTRTEAGLANKTERRGKNTARITARA
jgi:hypothetical protein